MFAVALLTVGRLVGLLQNLKRINDNEIRIFYLKNYLIE